MTAVVHAAAAAGYDTLQFSCGDCDWYDATSAAAPSSNAHSLKGCK